MIDSNVLVIEIREKVPNHYLLYSLLDISCENTDRLVITTAGIEHRTTVKIA